MVTINMTARRSLVNAAVTVADMEGVLDVSGMTDFEEMLEGQIRDKHYQLVLDMRKLTYMSIAAVGVLIDHLGQFRNHKGDIRMFGLDPMIKKELELMEVLDVIKTFKKEEDAVDSFSKKEQPFYFSGKLAPFFSFGLILVHFITGLGKD